MFTGIIQEIGILQKKEKKEENILLTIQARGILPGLKEGMSVAVNGVCLTCEYFFKDAFKAAVIPETLSKTNLGFLHVGSRINLEPAMSIGDKFNGHIVTGHIDDVGKTIEKTTIQGGVGLKIQFPQALAKFLAFKGSIAVNGVSLTIAELKEDTFTVALIPYTQQHTNLGTAQEGDIVNLEIDIVARYLDRIMQDKANAATYEFLKERNLL